MITLDYNHNKTRKPMIKTKKILIKSSNRSSMMKSTGKPKLKET